MTRPMASLAALMLLSATGAEGAAFDPPHQHVPPGDPCGSGPGVGTGNPCGGNNGNDGAQGNGSGVTYDNPPPFSIPRPEGDARGAYIDQVGATNRATIVQSNPDSFAHIHQTGEGHVTAVSQRDSGAHYADLDIEGEDNHALVAQSGAGDQVALIVQHGADNALGLTQEGAVSNGAMLLQYGDDNAMALAQSGGDNQAVLSQNGSGNTMTAQQSGDGNRLIWAQNGDRLKDLGVTQSGGMAIQITQQR